MSGVMKVTTVAGAAMVRVAVMAKSPKVAPVWLAVRVTE